MLKAKFLKTQSAIKGVIFDWNGTLSNDITKIFTVTMKTVVKTGGTPIRSYQEYRGMVRNPFFPFYRELGCTAPRAEIHRWYVHYLEHVKIPVALFRGAKAILSFLKSKHIQIGVVSSHPSRNIRREAKKYKILQYLDPIYGDLHTKDRHISLFLKRFYLKPKEVIYIGDMTSDIRTGKKCGVITAAYLKGVHTKEKLLKEHPDIVLPTLTALKRYIS